MEVVVFDKSLFDQVQKIYKQGLDTGIATFEVTVPEWESWDRSHLDIGRIAVVEHNSMLGWAALSPVSNRCVYGGVAEVSVYVSASARGKSVGTILLNKLIQISEQHNIWTLQAGIFRENIASLQLHKKCGFRVIGYREKIGQRNGVWKDNIILERRSKVVGI
ncbi:MAG: N-acetyltransferase [Saprospiraceae bacterium]|nr:N-acetyltransferase [Saprospiraceae bacterium]